jgi:hypothetical protein
MIKSASGRVTSPRRRSTYLSSSPGMVGRKKGAALGFLGGALGLFLARITSRHSRFSHLNKQIQMQVPLEFAIQPYGIQIPVYKDNIVT